ncbi:hypothetical protein H8B06_14535 [Sphingobacterium sp. DN00404]|uniref:Tetratricopeptide repeat protein n=1 Tax=Sphingobacterium micropteri TaxID=2763501 RepID=A0ABR7YRT9_9SPHI|nr:hypothetical protein [Sphingobacterium micropteri]MBD1434051.1 hypothetical protein [Sphingobacterium micropteri]
MAEYIIKRAKMEAVYAFVDNLTTVFKDSTVYRLFPATDHFIQTLNNTYDIVILKDALKKDLNTLPERIFRDSSFVQSQKLYSFWIYLQLYDILMDRGSIEEAFEKLNNSIQADKNLIGKLRGSSVGKALLLSVNLIDYLNTNDFARVYDFFDSEENLEELSAMLFALSIDANDTAIIRELPIIKKDVAAIYRNYNLVKKQIHTLQSLSGQKPTADFEGYRQYQKDLLLDVLRRTASLLTSGAAIVKYIEIDNKKPRNEGEQKDPNKIQEERRKEYRDQQQLMYSLNNGIDAWFDLKEGNYARAMFTLSDALLVGPSEQNEKISTFLSVSGEIANASSTAEISDIIARYTLPVASHKTKKIAGKSFMITAYAGLSGARFIRKNNIDEEYGMPIIAAIGPEYSFGLTNGISLSGMVTLLDLGNIVQYKLRKDEGEKEEISFARAFSPGILFALSPFPKIPVAFTASFMSNPGRFQVGTVLDMPLFGIYKWTKGK